jgi:hypothetical protein
MISRGVLLAVVAVLVLSGCGDGSEEAEASPVVPSPTETTAATAGATGAVSEVTVDPSETSVPEDPTEPLGTPTPEPRLWHVGPVPTGVQAYDGIVAAVLDGDVQSLLALVEMQALGCVPSAPNELVIAPGCAAGEAEGTVVEVFPIGVCHPAFLRDTEPLLEQMVAEVRGLYGIAVEREGGQARVVFAGDGFGPGYDPAYVAYVSEVGRIVEIHHSCGGPDFYLNGGDEADVLVAPPS